MADFGLRHLSIRTRDLERAVEFYTRLIGLEVAFRAPPSRVFLRWPGEGDLLDLVRSPGRIPRRGGLEHFGFKVPRSELRRIEKRLRGAPVRIEGRRGRDSIYFRDRDGYLVECYCD